VDFEGGRPRPAKVSRFAVAKSGSGLGTVWLDINPLSRNCTKELKNDIKNINY